MLRTNTDLNVDAFSEASADHPADLPHPWSVFCSFLALVLETGQDERIALLKRVSSWSEIIADLDSLAETRSSTTANASSSARRRALPPPWPCGQPVVALPPTIRDAAVS